MREIFKKNKRVKISILVALLVFISALIFWFLYPSATPRSASTNNPALPDLTGQPKILVDYLQKMNEEALKAPFSDQAVGNLAMVYQSNFFYDEAKVCYDRAVELNPREWRWIYYSALIDEELGDTKATIEKLERVLEINPEVSQAWFRLGNSYLKMNSYQDAERSFNRVLSIKEYSPVSKSTVEVPNTGAFPLKAYASLNLARAAFLQDRTDEARKLLEGLIRENPSLGPAYRLLGNVYQKMGDKNKGAEFELRAGDFESYIPPADLLYDEIVLHSRNTAFLIKYLDLAAKSETYAWTLTLMNHLSEIDPNDGEVLTKRIKLALDMQRLATVDSLLPSFHRICGSDEKKLIDLAKYFVYRGHYEPAVMLLKSAITINQKALEAHILFIEILTEFRQYEMGINYCKELLSTEPKNADLRIKLAGMFIEKGEIEEARKQIITARQLSPNNEMNLVMLARISKKEGSVKNALDYYQKAVRANSRNVDAQLEFGEYLVNLRRWDDAYALYQISLKASPNNIDLVERYAWILAVCPADDLGNGKKALELANRLALRRKYTKDQEMRCGITLAAAYARAKQFEKALEVANKYLGYARTMKQSTFLHTLQAMTLLFRDHRPYGL
ncbi:tetratricopeptide repeat protein [bacterium]|nr:MAG: tetratricopeptide repeat protein [bacterium]